MSLLVSWFSACLQKGLIFQVLFFNGTVYAFKYENNIIFLIYKLSSETFALVLELSKMILYTFYKCVFLFMYIHTVLMSFLHYQFLHYQSLLENLLKYWEYLNISVAWYIFHTIALYYIYSAVRGKGRCNVSLTNKLLDRWYFVIKYFLIRLLLLLDIWYS